MDKRSKSLLNLHSNQTSLFFMEWVDNNDGTHTLETRLRGFDSVKTVDTHETIDSKEYMIMKLKGEL